MKTQATSPCRIPTSTILGAAIALIDAADGPGLYSACLNSISRGQGEVGGKGLFWDIQDFLKDMFPPHTMDLEPKSYNVLSDPSKCIPDVFTRLNGPKWTYSLRTSSFKNRLQNLNAQFSQPQNSAQCTNTPLLAKYRQLVEWTRL